MKKTNVWILLCALLASSTVFVSCDDDDDDATAQDNMMVAAFLQNAAMSDMFEITTGNMAEDKGQNSATRTFGTMLVNDHTMTSMEIMEMAEERDVTLPTTLPTPKQTIVTRLNSETGITFDKDFAATQVQSHQEAIALFETADQQIMDAEVQAFIDATLPALRMHLTHVQQLKTTVDAM